MEFQGSYTFSDSRVFTLGIDQLQISSKTVVETENEMISMLFKAGRLPFSDFSGKVFSHTGDGMSVDWNLPSMALSVFCAASGLLQQPAKQHHYEQIRYCGYCG